ncbi:MAG: DUF1579 family protein [Pseudomonadota bacterium]
MASIQRTSWITAVALVSMVQTGFSNTSHAEEQALLPASARLALPAEKHAWLDRLVGEWSVEMRVYPEPGATPIVATNFAATREWRLGGRYLEERLTGTFAGNAAERVMILGYNNLEQRFELASFDTFEPGHMIYQSRGSVSPNRFSLYGESTEAGNYPKPTGRRRDLRFEFSISNDRSEERIFVTYPGKDEYLFVQQIFTRSGDTQPVDR